MTENDPFLQNPGSTRPEPPQVPATPPAPPASSPGVIAGATPPPVPAYGAAMNVQFDRSGVPLEKPEGLAKGLIAVTAAVTVATFALAMLAQGDVDTAREAAESGDITFGAGSMIGLISFPLTVASFVLYGLWMTRMRRNREAMGRRTGLPAVEWWGWFVPLASVVLIPLGARKVTGRSASLGVLLGWWITWTIAQALSTYASFAMTFAFDLETGGLTNPDLLDSYPMWVWASAAVTLISWAFLFTFIRSATQRHLDADA